MKSILVLIVSGKYFFLEDKNYSERDMQKLIKLAENKEIFFEEFMYVEDENSICTRYIEIAESKYNIKLKRLNIRSVLRIK